MSILLERTQLQLAGMSDDEGRLAHFPFPLGGVCPATLSAVDGNDLVWVFTMRPCYHHDVSTDELLDYFTRIKDGDGVLRFSRGYGVLSLCSHGHYKHEGGKDCPGPRNFSQVHVPGDDEAFLFREPLSGWLRHVEVVNAVLRVGAALHQGKSPSASDWQAIESDELLGYPLRSLALPPDWDSLLYVLDGWLLEGNIHPQVSMHDGRPRVTFGGDTWSTLGLQVVLSVTGEGRTAVCDGCNRVYPRTRKPQRGRRNFCQVCSEDGTADRMRQRDYAARHPDRVLAKSRKRAQGTRTKIVEQKESANGDTQG